MASEPEGKKAPTLDIRIFKNRTQARLTVEELRSMWTNGLPWSLERGELQRRPRLDKQYAGFAAWELPLAAQDESSLQYIVPCKAQVMCELSTPSGKEPRQTFPLRYETVQVSDPAPVVSGLVLMDVAKMKEQKARGPVDVSRLPDTKWLQFSTQSGARRLLLLIKKNPGFNTLVCMDDATGEGYPYILERVVVLMASGI